MFIVFRSKFRVCILTVSLMILVVVFVLTFPTTLRWYGHIHNNDADAVEISLNQLNNNQEDVPRGKYSGLEKIQGSMRALAADINSAHIWEGPEEPAASDCPKGKYRGTNAGTGVGSDNWDFETAMGCIPCPRGKYGSSTGLTSATCTFPCPKGRYGYRSGATSEDDCWHCPPGTYGSSTGLTDASCSGSCPTGKYSKEWGLTTSTDCEDCPVEYRGWQCRALWKTINVPTTTEDT